MSEHDPIIIRKARCPFCRSRKHSAYKTEPRQPGADHQIQRRKCAFCQRTFKAILVDLDPPGQHQAEEKPPCGPAARSDDAQGTRTPQDG